MSRIRLVSRELAQALAHLHLKDLIHADFKPQNAMRAGDVWQLIDLDTSCPIGQPFGGKPPSSGYCPPEMAKILLAAGYPQPNGPRPEGGDPELANYTADVSYDLWSFGCVLFHLATAAPLWKCDLDDNVSRTDLQTLASWSKRTLNRALLESGVDQQMPVLCDLLGKLLEPDPEARLQHWKEGVEMSSVLGHLFFFSPSSMDDTQKADLAKLTREVSVLRKNQDHMISQQDHMISQLDSIQESLSSQTRMLATLLKGDHDLPSLVCFLPAVSDSGTSNAMGWWHRGCRPADLFGTEVMLFFVDPITLTRAGPGFSLRFTKDWVVKAMPYLKVGLTTLKLAAFAGRLAGFPVPTLMGDWLGDQLDALAELRDDAVAELCKITGANHEVAQEGMDAIDSRAAAAMSSVAADVVAAATSTAVAPEGSSTGEPIELAAKELRSLLNKKHPDWQDNTGLVPAVCAKEGWHEWVLPKHKAEFEVRGSSMLSSMTSEQAGMAAGAALGMQERERQRREQSNREKDELKKEAALREKELQKEAAREKDELERAIREKDELQDKAIREKDALERAIREKDELQDKAIRKKDALEKAIREKDELQDKAIREKDELEKAIREKDELRDKAIREKDELQKAIREKDELLKRLEGERDKLQPKSQQTTSTGCWGKDELQPKSQQTTSTGCCVM